MNITKNIAEYISALYSIHDAGTQTEIHRHDNALGGSDFELVYVVSGYAKNVITGQEPKSISAGDYFFLDGGIEHCYLVEEGEDLMIINLIFDNRAVDLWHKRVNSLAELASFYGINPKTDDNRVRYDFYFKDDKDESVKRLFTEIDSELSARLPGYYEAVRCRLMEILIKGFRQYFNRDTTIQCSPDVRYVINYLTAFYMESTTLSSLAKELRLSLPYLSKKFKEEVGQTYLEYLHARRISESCRMLSTSDVPIESIAEFIGYSDSKKYREKFKEIVGISPREYRKRRRDQN